MHSLIADRESIRTPSRSKIHRCAVSSAHDTIFATSSTAVQLDVTFAIAAPRGTRTKVRPGPRRVPLPNLYRVAADGQAALLLCARSDSPCDGFGSDSAPKLEPVTRYSAL